MCVQAATVTAARKAKVSIHLWQAALAPWLLAEQSTCLTHLIITDEAQARAPARTDDIDRQAGWLAGWQARSTHENKVSSAPGTTNSVLAACFFYTCRSLFRPPIRPHFFFSL